MPDEAQPTPVTVPKEPVNGTAWGKNMPEPEVDKRNPNVEKINLHEVVLKQAAKENLTWEDLKRDYVTTEYEFRKEAARQYYGGRGVGYIAGAADASRLAPRWLPWAAFAAGVVAFPAAKLALKLSVVVARFLWHTYNS